MRRATIIGGAFAAGLVILALALAAGRRRPEQEVDPVTATSPAITPSTVEAPEAHEGYLYGRVTTEVVPPTKGGCAAQPSPPRPSPARPAQPGPARPAQNAWHPSGVSINRRDDNGAMPPRKENGAPDFEQGDLVWSIARVSLR